MPLWLDLRQVVIVDAPVIAKRLPHKISHAAFSYTSAREQLESRDRMWS
ncbi:hypothetical protein [Actinomadura chokoriensis]|uniref:Uncharacterized protein n=1 Tax=Actinomadura chokoriensis TaxID=454156 RepID=A0ABV4R582_9ACTN